MATDVLDRDAIWADVIGQPRAVAQLQAAADSPVHGYYFVGPRGSGKRAAVRAFAAELLAAGRVGDDRDRQIRLALAGKHPDVVLIEPEGKLFRGARGSSGSPATEGQRLIDAAFRSPMEGARQVVVADRFHTANPIAVGRLLKVLEEPPAPTILVLLGEEIPDDQATIISRCVQIDFSPVGEATIVEHLRHRDVDEDRARAIASASSGSVERALMLSTDPSVGARQAAWADAVTDIDGSGATVARLVDSLTVRIDEAQAALDEQQAIEVAEATERMKELGQRGSAKKALEVGHNRQVRSLREEELRFGLATMAGAYRDRLADSPHPRDLVEAIARIQGAAESFEFNPNEKLLLQGLFLALPQL